MNPYNILRKKGHKGKFTQQFRNRKQKNIKTIREYAHFIKNHPKSFNKITKKRANFYINLIE